MFDHFKERSILRNTTYLLIVIAFAFFGTYIYIDNKLEIINYGQKFNVPKVETLSEEEIALERLKMLPAVRKEVNIIEQTEESEMITPISEDEAMSIIAVADTPNKSSDEFVSVQSSEMYIKYESGQTATISSVEDGQIKPYLSSNATYTTLPKDSNQETMYKSFTGSVVAVEDDRFVLSGSNDGGYFIINKKGGYKIFLNGKRITQDNINVGDKILFEGQINANQNSAVSGTITITGYSQLLTI